MRFNKFPDTLIPIGVQSSEANTIFDKVYEFPEKLDDITSDVLPWVAQLKSIRDSGDFKIYGYKIREEAKWDFDNKIDSDDIETTLKIINLPKIDNQSMRLNLSYIKGINIKDDNHDIFELVALGSRENLRPRIGRFYILPRHIYDPDGLLDDLELEEIINEYENLQEDPRVLRYAKFLASDGFRSELKKGGSGPYKIELSSNYNSILFK